MADIKNNSRNARTTSSIKRALLNLLNRKSLDAVTMSELAREAQVSRSTLYQHYGNVHEVYADVVSDFDERVAPVMSQLECYEGIEPEGTLPFCTLLRTSDMYERAIEDPRFLDTLIGEGAILQKHSLYQSLVASGYTPAVASVLSVFQVNGCFRAARMPGLDEATWREAREAIDVFICGGLDACRRKKLNTTKAGQPRASRYGE